MRTSNAGAERRLRLQAEELIAGAASPAPEVAEAFESLDAEIAAAVRSGDVGGEWGAAFEGDVLDALAARGTSWLVPTLPALDVAALYEQAYGDGPLPEPPPPSPAAAETDGASPWWADLDPLEVAGPAGAPDHVLRWERGRLLLEAHGDAEAEAALAALGGVPCPCVDVRAAWRAAHDDAALLTVASRHAGDPLLPLGSVTDELVGDRRRWHGALTALVDELAGARDVARLARVRAIAAPIERQAGARVGELLLLGLDGRLLDRLQASVASAVARSGIDPVALEVAIAARARPVLERLGWTGGFGDVRVGDEPAVGALEVVLPPDWLTTVWGRGLASAVPGHLVVTAGRTDDAGVVEVVAGAPGKAQVARRVDQWENAGAASSPGAT